jgi:hypothetical protein
MVRNAPPGNSGRKNTAPKRRLRDKLKLMRMSLMLAPLERHPNADQLSRVFLAAKALTIVPQKFWRSTGSRFPVMVADDMQNE